MKKTMCFLILASFLSISIAKASEIGWFPPPKVFYEGYYGNRVILDSDESIEWLYSVKDGEATIVGIGSISYNSGTKKKDTLEYPTQVHIYPVKNLASRLLDGVYSMPHQVDKKVVVPEGILRIENNTFMDSNLKGIQLPMSLEFIGEDAFMGSTLQSLVIPAGVKTISSGAFADCSKLTKITVSEENSNFKVEKGFLIEKASMTVLHYFGNQRKVTIPEGIVSIQDKAFRGNSKMTEVVLPSSLESIGVDAFRENALSRFTVIEGNQHFAVVDEALLSKDGTLLITYPRSSKAKRYTVPESVNTIAQSAFFETKNLKEIILNEGLEDVGNSAFACADKKTVKVTLPDTLISIGEFAFRGCSFDNELVLPKSLVSIGWAAFSHSSYDKLVISEGIVSFEPYAFSYNNKLREVFLPKSLEYIPRYAFSLCESLEIVHGMESVSMVSPFAFDGCLNLVTKLPDQP